MSPVPSKNPSEVDPSRSRDVLEENVYLKVLEVKHVLEREIRELFEEHDLTSRQYNVLRTLYVRGSGGLSCQSIGEQLVTSVSDISRLIDRLSEKNLVERQRSEEDRRVVRIHLTEKGKQSCQAVDDRLVQRIEELFDHMEREELEQLNDHLQTVLDGFDSDEKGGV